MKRILLLIGTILLIGIATFFVWFIFFYTPTEDAGTPFEQENAFGTFFDTEFQNRNEYNPSFENLDREDFISETNIPILRQLSREPVAGYTFFKKEFEFDNPDFVIQEGASDDTPAEKIIEEKYVFRFMERVTGHIYDTFEHNVDTDKVTNTTTQKVYNAIFSNNGETVLFEKLNDFGEGVDSFFGEIVEEEEEEEENLVSNTTLDIRPYSIISENFIKSPTENLFASMVESNNSSTLVMDSFDSTNKTSLHSTPLKDVLYSWDNEDFILKTTKPSSGKIGYAYLIDTRTGAEEKILSEIPGLTAKISPDGAKVLYSTSERNSIILRILNLETGEDRRLATPSLPEKCVFSNTNSTIIYCGSQSTNPTGLMPDDWYKGRVSFNDNIWKINTETGLTEIAFSFNQTKFGRFDMFDLRLTESDEFLVFKNKKDLTLWSLNLKELDNKNSFIPEEPQEAF